MVERLWGIRRMQEDNCEASTSITQLLRESYLAEVRIQQEHGEKSRLEGISQHFHYGSKSGGSQDLDGQDESPDLSAFLSQEELDKSVNLAQQAIALCSHEVNKDEKQINLNCPNKDLSDICKPPGNKKVLESTSSSTVPEKSNDISYERGNFIRSPSSSEENYKQLRKQPKSTSYCSETESKKDYLSKAADFIEELSSLFKTNSSKRIKPRACKSSRSRAQAKSRSQSQHSNWSVDERERAHVPFSTEVYGENNPKEESEETEEALVSSASVENITIKAENNEVQSKPLSVEDTKGDPPRFTQRLKSREAAEGSRVQLECIVTGLPKPEVRWYCEGKELKNSPDIQIAYNGNQCSLIISEAFEEDTGRYTCLASNIYGSDTTSAEIYIEGVTSSESEHDSAKEEMNQIQDPNPIGVVDRSSPHNSPNLHSECHQLNCPGVQSPVQPIQKIQSPTNFLQGLDGLPLMAAPVFIKPLQDVTAIEGQLVVLECRIKGVPFPKIEWYREETLIEDSPEFRILQKKPRSMSDSEEICTLVIAEAFAEDSGVFTCTASNKYGTMSSMAHLSVRGIEDYNAVNLNSSSSVTVEATATDTQIQPNKILLPPTVPFKPKLESVLVNHQDHKPKAGLRVHFKLPEDDTGSEPSFEGGYDKTNKQNAWTSVPISPTKEPPPVYAKPKLDPIQLQQLHNQVLLEQQQEVNVLQSTTQSSSLPTTFPPASPSTMNTHTDNSHQSAQMPSASSSTQGVLKKVLKSPQSSTNDEIRESKDAVKRDLDRKSNFRDDVYHTGQQRVTYEDKVAYRFLGQISPSLFNFHEVKDMAELQEYKVSNFEQRLMNEIEFRLERTPVDESDDEIQHEDIPTGKCIAPIFDKKLKHFRVVEGSPVTISCKLIGIPVPKVYWFKDGKQISKKNEHYKMKREGDGTCSLYIESATNDDDGNYTVMAANPQGRTSCSGHLMVQNTPFRGRVVPSVQSQRTRSRVSEEPVQERFFCPHFLQAPGNMIAHEGQICRLDCKVSGLPNPDLMWLLDGKPVLPDATHKMLVRENGIHSLLIDHLTANDAGTYTCIATNKAGQNSFSLELSIVAKEITKAPVFIEKLQNTGVAEGHPVRLDCRVLGMPPPFIFWKKDNETIMPNRERISMHRDPTGYVCLLIQPTKKEDAGWYTVSAKNEAGITSCTARLDLYAQWHQNIKQQVRKVQSPSSRYAAFSIQGLDLKSASPSVDTPQIATKLNVMESDEL
ncbi:myopalladin isoform X3 [Mobula birostris]|uniref:myopalladin isoform X3 n=1 Tax=Mobula birostris TaxID=1983395 RepID=UPI003B27D185